MKETIEYYYNIDINDINEINDNYHFKYENKDYFFTCFNRSEDELNDIIKCINDMKDIGIEVDEIVLNINQSCLTTIDNINYILLSVISPSERYDIFDIIENSDRLTINNKVIKMYRNNWEQLWSDKVDYFEYQIRELGLNKEVIINSFSYYIGLAENAISFVHYANSKKAVNYTPRITWSHRRLFYPNYKLNYYNPLSFVFDIEVRDIAEYLKSMFFKIGLDGTIDEMKYYLKLHRLDNYMYHMLFARLLYPTYYFDIYEEVMNKKREEDDLIKIIQEVDNYELFLKKAYLEISKYANLTKIDWLIY